MPRLFDFDNADPVARGKAYEEGQTFPYLAETRSGKFEIDLREIHGPHGLFFMDGENHQFRRVVKGNNGNRNGEADELFDWLEKNAKGRWHWMETSSNHGRSLTTRIYIDIDSDAQAFRQAFPDQLQFDEQQHLENAEIKLRCLNSDTGIHPAMNAACLAHLIEWNDQESRQYIADISERPGFPKLFAGSIGELRKHGKIDESTLLDRLAGIIENLIPGNGREAVVAYLERSKTPFVEALFERLETSPTRRP